MKNVPTDQINLNFLVKYIFGIKWLITVRYIKRLGATKGLVEFYF